MQCTGDSVAWRRALYATSPRLSWIRACTPGRVAVQGHPGMWLFTASGALGAKSVSGIGLPCGPMDATTVPSVPSLCSLWNDSSLWATNPGAGLAVVNVAVSQSQNAVQRSNIHEHGVNLPEREDQEGTKHQFLQGPATAEACRVVGGARRCVADLCHGCRVIAPPFPRPIDAGVHRATKVRSHRDTVDQVAAQCAITTCCCGILLH
mmetsp:Transcript_18446/g.52112  ORF Transcript_18446/g.52112 Transcript_18446/m.52112 type:complete len:207 (-) Transcript_18446:103-723(-)